MTVRASGKSTLTSCFRTFHRKPFSTASANNASCFRKVSTQNRSPSLRCFKPEGILAAKARSPMFVWPADKLPNLSVFGSTGAKPVSRHNRSLKACKLKSPGAASMQVAWAHLSQLHPVAAMRSRRVKTALGLPPSPCRLSESQPTWRGAICIRYMSPIFSKVASSWSATCTILSWFGRFKSCSTSSLHDKYKGDEGS